MGGAWLGGVPPPNVFEIARKLVKIGRAQRKLAAVYSVTFLY